MDLQRRSKLRIAIVTTRDLTEQNGRTPIIREIVRTLGETEEVTLFRLRSITEIGRIGAILGAAVAWIVSLIRLSPLPLQCVLYAARSECREITKRIQDFDADCVYLDTVRCQVLLRRLRKSLPNLHVVTDFDDLMSHRAAYLRRNRLPFAPGHVAKHFPPWLRYLVEAPMAQAIVTYEAATLPGAENEVARASAATVLLSPVDRDRLRRRPALAGHETVHSILPAARIQGSAWDGVPPLRFVFIGSDFYLQNRTALDLLVRIWHEAGLSTPLHVYGRQRFTRPSPPAIRWHGFVEALSEVYQPGSIALAPSLDRGGIKTKVIEAWAWGCPVLGNPAAFEGLAIKDYPLVLPEADWPALMARPESYRDLWAAAARIGNSFVGESLLPEGFEQAWKDVIQPRRHRPEVFALPAAGSDAEPVLR
ncbi:MAG: glycosyltransferase family 4 protein [Aliidongia sp.]